MRKFTFWMPGKWQRPLRQLFLLMMIGICGSANAQMPYYIFSQSTGATYTPITGGTVVATATSAAPAALEGLSLDDTTFLSLPLPFTFNFNGADYTTINVNTNGWASFGATGTSTSAPISSTNAYSGVISAIANDMMGISCSVGDRTTGSPTLTNVGNTSNCKVGAPIQGTGIDAGTTILSFTSNSITMSSNATTTSTGAFVSWATGEIRVETLGSAPNQTYVIQFSDMAEYSTSAGTTNNTGISFQIRINEGGGVATAQTIEFLYGNVFRLGGTETCQVGLRGATNAVYKNRSSTTDWAATIAGTSNSSTITWTLTSTPASGLSFLWTPATCFVPTAVTVPLATITTSSAEISWTAPAAAPGNGYEYYYSTTSTPPTGSTTPSGTTPAGVTTVTISPLNSATTYYIWVRSACSASDKSEWTNSVTFNTKPANDEAATAIGLTVNPDYNCGTTTNGSTINSTQSAEAAPTCSNTGINDDVWFSFVATGTAHRISFTNVTTGTMVAALYTGTPGSLTFLTGVCASTTLNATGLTSGTTYYVRAYTSVATTATVTNFTICVGTPPPPPANDNAAGATALTVNADLACGVTTTGTTISATQSPDAAPTCSATGIDDDVWYTFVATTSEHRIVFSGVSAGTMVAALYTGTPGSLTFLTGACASTTLNATGLTGGTTYYVRAYNTATTSATQSNFTICVGTPPSMTYTSSTTTHPLTGTVAAGSTNQQILRVEVVVTGSISPLSLTQLNFSTNGTTNVADIDSAKVYYTGTSTTFATTTKFGSTITDPSGAFNVTGSQVLTGGGTATSNYFWLVYDINCGATVGNFLDAEGTSVTVGAAYTPTQTAPTGNRAVAAPVTVATLQPSTTATVSGAVNAQVLRVDVPGSACLGSISSLNFTNASTNVADIAKARVFYTTSTTFSNAVQFGNDVVSPGASFSVAGSQASAASGTTNYFWLVFDITCAAPATVGNVADASVTGVVTTSIGTLTAATPNPAGTRTITAITPGDNIQNATEVVLGLAGGNPFDINGKTLQTGEPSSLINSQPAATNGSGTSNYSWGSAAGGTQWYKLTVPMSGYGSSGNLLVRATTTSTTVTDMQIALWKFPNLVPGGDCSTVPNFTDGILLAANDDAIVTGTGYTVGGTLNSVMRVRLTPGSTYYIQMDGFTTAVPTGDLIVEDLADAAGKNVPNNGFGTIHDPTAADMKYASYEVVGDDGWTYYYSNNGTTTNIADDVVLMGLNWSTSTTYLWKGTSATGNDLLNHVRRSATSTSAPSAAAPASATGSDAFIVWSGKVSAPAISGNLKTTAPYVVAPLWYMLNKVWNVFPNVQPVTSIGVRSFYSDADFTTLQTAITGAGGVLASKADIKFIKMTKTASTHYTNAEIDPAGGHAAILAGTVTELVSTTTASVQSGMNRADFSIGTFSGGGGGSNGAFFGGPLPITLVYFKGSKSATGNHLDWKVNCTSVSISFEIERSSNGRNYTSIGSFGASQARCLTPFDFADSKPLAGVNYYRIKIIDLDGEVSYTNVVAINNKVSGIEIIGMQPTLVQSEAVLYIAAAKAGKLQIAVTDMTGRQLETRTISVLEGENKVRLNFGTLAAGVYNLSSFNESGKTTIRFVKE
ncbi:MAG: BNR-repeat neuraminidase N-terminal domain-containing protein [Bacteroidota bacterium]